MSYGIELKGARLRRYQQPEVAWVYCWCAPGDAVRGSELMTWPTRKGAEGWMRRNELFTRGAVVVELAECDIPIVSTAIGPEGAQEETAKQEGQPIAGRGV